MVFDNFTQMFTDEDAVSPVIGVILMVAVTVVLAAVIGAFVFGIGDSLGDPAPNAQIDFDYDADTNNLVILHDGGDSITSDNTGLLSVTGDVNAPSASPDDVWGPNFADPATVGENTLDSEPESAVTSGAYIFDTSRDIDTTTTPNTEGDSFGDVESGDALELQWESNGGDQSTTLGTFEAP